MVDIATKQIIPAVIRYTTVLAESINSVKAVSAALDVSVQTSLLENPPRFSQRPRQPWTNFPD